MDVCAENRRVNVKRAAAGRARWQYRSDRDRACSFRPRERRRRIFLLAAGRTTTNEELEEMLEQGNPAVFTQGVHILNDPCLACACTLRGAFNNRPRPPPPPPYAIQLILPLVADHHGDATSKTDPRGHRSASRRHH